MTARMPRNRMVMAVLALIALAVATSPVRSDPDRGAPRAVYAMTNHPTGNTIVVFDRFADGSLHPAGEFPTGGLGTGGGSDPLRSQGSLILSRRGPSHRHSQGSGHHESGRRDSRQSGRHASGEDDDDDDGDDDDGGSRAGRDLLFAVNAGSNEVSVLRVEDHGLVLVDKVSSGGIRPTSLALHDGLLYVLNAGSGNITGFTVGHSGRLAPLPGSTRPLTGGSAADPAQVAFDPSGRLLVVTEKMTNLIDTYLVGRDGRPTGPRSSPSHGMTPFGFGFDQRGTLVVSEAFGGLPDQGAVSSYEVSRTGALRVVSGSVRETS
jgi:6-phosphogluconolactonase